MMTEIPQSLGKHAACLTLGGLTVDMITGDVTGPEHNHRLEPKVIELLALLSRNSDVVLSRDEIETHIWDGNVVAEDSVARLVSKLRKGLGDQTTAPTFIETLPKRGYRLIADVNFPVERDVPSERTFSMRYLAVFIGLAAIIATLVWYGSSDDPEPSVQTIDLANFYYDRLTPDDIQQSVALFRRAVDESPQSAEAHTGLANALAQSVLRIKGRESSGMLASVAETRQEEPQNISLLNEAIHHADEALRIAPDKAEAWKAKGLVLSAKGQLDEAANAYGTALELDPDYWAVMLNLAEIRIAQERYGEWENLFERAYATIQRTSGEDLETLTRYAVPIANSLGYHNVKRNELHSARLWFRSALKYSPLDSAAREGMKLAGG